MRAPTTAGRGTWELSARCSICAAGLRLASSARAASSSALATVSGTLKLMKIMRKVFEVDCPILLSAYDAFYRSANNNQNSGADG